MDQRTRTSSRPKGKSGATRQQPTEATATEPAAPEACSCAERLDVSAEDHRFIVESMEQRGAAGVVDLLEAMQVRAGSQPVDGLLDPADFASFVAMHNWTDDLGQLGAFRVAEIVGMLTRRWYEDGGRPRAALRVKPCTCQWAGGDTADFHDRLLALDGAGPAELADLMSIVDAWGDGVWTEMIPPYEWRDFARFHSWADSRGVGELLSYLSHYWEATHNARQGRSLATETIDAIEALVDVVRRYRSDLR